jgi:transcriptional regulator with XRE-family HTH domain
MQIGEHVKFWRETRNYTEEYMASQLGISQSAYSKIEKGKIKIDAERLFRLCTILSVSVDELSPHANNLPNHVNGVTFSNHGAGKETADATVSKTEREFYEKLISEKDKLISEKQETISLLKEMLNYFKMVKNDV